MSEGIKRDWGIETYLCFGLVAVMPPLRTLKRRDSGGSTWIFGGEDEDGGRSDTKKNSFVGV